ncbi:MAG: hypothetical protein ACRECQ_00600, partial [Burkholderiaceae bacterium]
QHWIMQPGTMQSSLNTTTRMTVNSACVDMLVGTFVSDVNTTGQVVPGQTVVYADPEAVGLSNLIYDGTWGNSHTNVAFQRGYISTANDDFRSQWSINNVDVGYNKGITDVFGELKEEFNLGNSTLAGINPRIKNVKNFAQGYAAVPLRLNLKATTEEKDTGRYLSGLDARGATVNVLWRTAGTLDGVSNAMPQVWCQSTNVVEIRPGQQFNLIA